MAEIWLKSNRRALAYGLLLPALVIAMGVVRVVSADPVREQWWRTFGYALVALGVVGILLILRQMRQPRLAYEDRHLLVYLRAGSPFRVPIDIVEGFLLGQGAAMLPRHQEADAATVVVRLADRAAEWSHQEVKPALGRWCDGYITVRGTWCEPLNVDLVSRLNARLAEVSQQPAKEGRS